MVRVGRVASVVGLGVGSVLAIVGCGGGDGSGMGLPGTVLGAPADDATGSGASGTGTTAATGSLCVDTINKYRASIGVKPLARWTDAEACSSNEAASDAATKRPHGAFGKCGEMAQNECPGWQGPDSEMIGGCLEAMWDEGPGGGHYDTMANPKLTKVACGFHTLPDGKVWAVQNFK